ncbi:MAG TPA: hypothetical protein VFG30_15865 [Polyangiales bacterium]|nr:hypothetical protein [Polyangiales bacterium]
MPVNDRVDGNIDHSSSWRTIARKALRRRAARDRTLFSQRALATSRICAFITRPGLQYGLTRMMAAWIEYKGYNAFVTTHPQEAVNWLKSATHEVVRQ